MIKTMIRLSILSVTSATVLLIFLSSPSFGQPPMPVVVRPVVQAVRAPRVELVGTALAARISRVAAEVAGLVKAVHFEAGDRVEDGAVLVELDRANQELGLRAARAGLAGARVRLQEARSDLARSRTLRQTKTVSAQDYEKDVYRVRNMEQAVLTAEAEVARLADTISRMTVKAPFRGYTVERATEVGQWLNPGAAVATLMDLSRIKVRVALPERYVGEIKAGDEALVVFDALGDKKFSGRVSVVIPLADANSRSLPVEVTLENPQAEIKAGLLARVVLTGTERRLLLAPKDALVLDRGKSVVFVLKNGTVTPVDVVVGEAHDGSVEVAGELKPGDRVVVQGNERLQPGQKVRVLENGASPSPTAAQ